MAEDQGKALSQFARIGILLAWTLACGSVWFAMVGTMGADPAMSEPGGDVALGAVACMTTGCLGGLWLFGVAVLALVYSFLRR